MRFYSRLREHHARLDLVDTVLAIVAAIALFGIVAGAEYLIGEDRMARRIEAVEIPPCSGCTEPVDVHYTPNTATLTSTPWRDGYTCPRPCLD